MKKLVVRWYPPYSTGYKDQPCQYAKEALLMHEWFQSIGVKASIVEIEDIERLIEDIERLIKGVPNEV